MKRNPNLTHALIVLSVIAITATIGAISNDAGNTNLDFETQFTIKPLPPWTPSPEREPQSPTERARISRGQASIALLINQFTNYMSEQSVDVNIRRCHYDIRRDCYDLEFDWQLPVTPEAGIDKIALVRMSGDSKYAIDAKLVAHSKSTLAVDIARQFTATLPVD